MAATPQPKGTVCIVPDPTEIHPNRHVVIISDIDRPYVGEEYTVAALTTASPETYSQPVVSVPYDEIIEGRLTKTCRVMPWSLHTISAEDIIKTPARLSSTVLANVADAIHTMLTS